MVDHQPEISSRPHWAIQRSTPGVPLQLERSSPFSFVHAKTGLLFVRIRVHSLMPTPSSA
ncbi:hypothetical protein [Conexivisphaera calida]|nr:hypothetical protein [Conexivisphaera calida]